MRTHRDEQVTAPVVLVKWYDWTKWLLDRVDSFPKNQRFIFGQRLADRSLRVLEILVEAAYGTRKAHLLAEANRQIEVLRWLLRLAMDRKLLTVRQFGFACKGLTECGRIRVCSSSVRRFDRRYKRLLWDLRHRRTPAARVTQSVRAWGAHVRHAQSYGLRRSEIS